MIGVLFGGYEIQATGVPLLGYRRAGRNAVSVPLRDHSLRRVFGIPRSGLYGHNVETGGQGIHVKPVGYGAMLAEAFVALIAIVTIMIVTPAEITGLEPGTIYGNGIGRFMTLLVGQENLGFAITFGAMAFSTFVFDTLDVCTRLGRYIIQELFGWKSWAESQRQPR